MNKKGIVYSFFLVLSIIWSFVVLFCHLTTFTIFFDGYGKIFEVHLILLPNAGDTVRLGNINQTLVKLISGKGTLPFERQKYIASETCGFVMISVSRLFSSLGEFSVKWKTINWSKG